ncbi:MAG: tetratricopeptide repeat protein [Sphingobacteriales bacterium]|nr:MAG: tetratricopeptide repeat protein [Sphingobacteriales bacterium]
MRKLFVLFLLLPLLSLHAAAQGYNATWQQANAFYNAKQYDQAAGLYEKLAQSQAGNAEVFYNLGNTYYRLNRIGPAVLNFQRALQRDPGHRSATENLELTSSRIPNRIVEPQDIFFVSWWKSLTSAQLADVWAVLSLILFIAGLVLLLLRRWRKVPEHLGNRGAAIVLVVSFTFLLFAYTASERKMMRHKAVVMSHDAPFTDEGSKQAKSLIPEGTTVTAMGEDQGRIRVILPDGRSGWMDASVLEKI